MALRLGVRLGQRRETSALCLAESEVREGKHRCEEAHFSVRHLERLPAGTAFPDLAERTATVVEKVSKHSERTPRVYVDATGLGQPVIDLFKSWVAQATVVAVFFTHGDRRVEESSNVIRLGKAYLVAQLQTLLQTGRLHLPRTDDSRILADDLLAYEIQIVENANERYGAFKVGTRDDLVTALGMAVHEDALPTWGYCSLW